MTEEKIIKAVELAEGFELNEKLSPPNSLAINYRNTSHVMKINEIKQWSQYPLLLRRAVEGFNSLNGKFIIDIGANVVIYKIDTFERQEIVITENNEYLTRQEQAIEKALEELL